MQIHLWPFRAVYYGASPDNKVHAHHALQICIGLEKELQVYSEQTAQTVQGRCLAIRQDVAHRVVAEHANMLVVYLEPEALQNQGVISALGDFGRSGVKPVPLAVGQVESIRCSLISDANVAVVWTILGKLLSRELFVDTHFPCEDKRIRNVIDIITLHRGQGLNLSQLSSTAFLSPSRLTHLFKQQTGISISQFLVWWRVRAAIEMFSRDGTLTEAAHASGFVDLAHMSKTFRRLFGFAPSLLFKHKQIDYFFY